MGKIEILLELESILTCVDTALVVNKGIIKKYNLQENDKKDIIYSLKLIPGLVDHIKSELEDIRE